MCQVRTLIQRDFKAALQDVDVLLSPVAPTAAYKIGLLHSTRLGSKFIPCAVNSDAVHFREHLHFQVGFKRPKP
jgi:Asp-tRNA(Asn)/Glu-tRNA(Gln) amidotransferase A subunit family amidase